MATDIYWDHAALECVYTDVMRYFNVHERVTRINKGLDWCDEFVKQVADMLNHRHVRDGREGMGLESWMIAELEVGMVDNYSDRDRGGL
jgi:uncharacterized Rmd1/YagE family protein